MTFNIHHGEGMDGRVDLARVAALVRDAAADIVFLQEVDRGVERTARRDLPAELESLTGMACVFSNNYAFQGGEYGNAILTRFPIRRWTNTHLAMLGTGEPRGVLQVVVDAGGHDLVLLGTHLDHRPDDAERLASVAQVRELLAQYGTMPVLFGGDFNATPESRTWTALSASFDDTWAAVGQGSGFTIPSRAPDSRIDYLWVSKGASVRPLRAWVPVSDASDHLPLVAEFEWGSAR
jgi:endonuclease/exonuclease/phosphatase family metal-dependent hydrolase